MRCMTVRGDLLPALVFVPILVSLLLPAPVRAATVLPECARTGEWSRFDGEHFILYTTARGADGTEQAKRLDRFARVFYRREPGMHLAGLARVVAFGLPRGECYDTFRPIFEGRPVESVGMFIEGPLGSYFQFRLSGKADDVQTIQHEYMHALSNEHMRAAPPCIMEGLAEYYGTMEIRGVEARFGQPIEEYCAYLGQSKLLTMDELFGIGYGEEYYQGERRDIFYVQSWALVHYLSTSGLAQNLREFILATNQGVPVDQAFATSFPHESWTDLPAALKRHVAQEDLSHASLLMGDTVLDGPIATRPVSRVEALTALGDLMRQQDRIRSNEAQAYYVAALEQAPRHGAALVGLAAINQARGYPKEALDLYARAERDSANDAVTWLRIGDGYVAEAMRDSAAYARRDDTTKARMQAARSAVARALRLDPGSREAAVLYARTLDGDTAAVVAGIDLLRGAHERFPQEADIADALVEAWLQHDLVDEAEAVVTRTYGRDATDPEGDRVRSRIFTWKLSRVNSLIRARRADEAIVALNEMRATATDPERVAFIDDWLARLQRTTKGNADVDQYNAAVALVKKGKIEEAIMIFDEVGKSAEDPALLLQAREAADRLRALRAQQGSASSRR